jgi:6-phosphogluconate dehydrogenase
MRGEWGCLWGDLDSHGTHVLLPLRHDQVNDGPCVMYIGAGGSGNFVKMVHNGIEYGDMQVGRQAGVLPKVAQALESR